MINNNSYTNRLIKDIKYLKKNPIENIFYKHDEKNIFLGYLLVIGAINTPYAYGFNYFKIQYPDTFPYQPPKLTYFSNDGYFRYNPNLYTNGKVCLSILNTWIGDKWTSCITLNTLFISLNTIFNDKPLLNEPCIKENDIYIDKYNLLIKYKNIENNICNSLFKLDKFLSNYNLDNYENLDNINAFNFHFYDIMIKTFIDNYDNIYNNFNDLENFCNIHNISKIIIPIYSIEIIFDFNKLKISMQDLENMIPKLNKYIHLL
tara:strand:+ start:221 stop:1003 length:783 start_codon:yes stop_codon:yes gene_type:complete